MVRRVAAMTWLRAFTGFYRPGADVRSLDAVSRFLYAARSVILVISAQAALIAGLLAAAAGRFHWLEFGLLLAGLVAAHMISNLSNDYFGFRSGHDTQDSPRMRYTVHPFAGGALERKVVLAGFAVIALTGAAVSAFFILERGWIAAIFVAAGILLLLAYDAGPLPLKTIGLGEAAVFLAWGPLMIGGGYFVIAGELSANAFLASIPYGLGVMSILVGKHVDQLDFDSARGIGTLPVLVGERAARALDIALIALMFALTLALIAAARLTPFAALVLAALPRAARAIRVLGRARPPAPPAGYVGWPLWYHRACLTHNRLFGWLYILGLAAGAAFH